MYKNYLGKKNLKMPELIAKEQAIGEYKKNAIKILNSENKESGSYEEWYFSLEGFRKELKDKYITYQSPFRTYNYRPAKLSYGHVLDYHIYSCLAPLNFKRNGWRGELLRPYEQIKRISDFFEDKGIRFIYVPLPNKSAIYPELISEKKIKYSSCVPQWRRYVRQLISHGIECVDLFPVFKDIMENEPEWNGSLTDSEKLFSRGHHISGTGAYVAGKELADYLKKTTNGFTEEFKLHEVEEIYNIGNGLKEKLHLCMYTNEKGFEVPYFNHINSPIAIFGDCNLQRNEMCGANISANLARELGYPIENIGRKLLFSTIDGIDLDTLSYLTSKQIVIYVAFASAAFVRTSQFYLRTLGRPISWNTIKF